MKNSIDLKRCLLIFDKVQTLGEKQGDKHVYQGLTAWTDFDGYTCFLAFNDVTLTMMFHGKYDITFSNEENLAKFEKKLANFDLA